MPISPLQNRRILLIIGGGIAAYKSLDLIRRLKERGAAVRVVMTQAAQQFVTPLVAGALSGDVVASDLFDLTQERDIGHIRLARDCDLIVVAPATADLMAKMAGGHADDLATACLVAARVPVLICPAMNPAMWSHPATRRNLEILKGDGIAVFGPASGEMAEPGEVGTGRMCEPVEIAEAIVALLAPKGPLIGRRALVTSGPTHEPIDPVRYIANRSSGKQGHAIAAALARAGAEVTLVSGPVTIADPAGVKMVRVTTAVEMLAAVEAALPADVAVLAAAVADWRAAEQSVSKIKKDGSGRAPALALTENPDILATLGHHATARPKFVVGFAAETDDVEANGRAKLERKAADLIVANDVSPARGVMGGDTNTVQLIGRDGTIGWPELPKDEVARRLVEVIIGKLRDADD